MAVIRVQSDDFDPGRELGILQSSAGAGAIASFIGIVRSTAERPLTSLTLEHYPAMTSAAVTEIAEQAELRFALQGCIVIHRFGRLTPGERIVFVGVAAGHRHAALNATEFLIDWLKTRAPFWKRECYADGEDGWVTALQEDDAAAERWGVR